TWPRPRAWIDILQNLKPRCWRWAAGPTGASSSPRVRRRCARSTRAGTTSRRCARSSIRAVCSIIRLPNGSSLAPQLRHQLGPREVSLLDEQIGQCPEQAHRLLAGVELLLRHRLGPRRGGGARELRWGALGERRG